MQKDILATVRRAPSGLTGLRKSAVPDIIKKSISELSRLKRERRNGIMALSEKKLLPARKSLGLLLENCGANIICGSVIKNSIKAGIRSSQVDKLAQSDLVSYITLPKRAYMKLDKAVKASYADIRFWNDGYTGGDIYIGVADTGQPFFQRVNQIIFEGHKIGLSPDITSEEIVNEIGKKVSYLVT